MTARDRTVVMALIVVAVMAAFWFGLLAPKRDTANKLAGQITSSRARLQTAQDSVKAALAAERGYAEDYATVARLGKAVPVQDDVPSLVYQLQTAAQTSKIRFNSIALSSGAASAPAPTVATPAAQAAQLGKDQKGQATPATAAAAPATQVAAAVLPPGASVGSAGFPTMPFDFSFGGSFFNLEGLLSKLNKFTSAGGNTINVRGRLLTVDGIALSGFPKMTATIHATAYLLPDDQGLLAGATPQSPSTATPVSTTTPSTTAPPVAVVTGVGR